MSLRSQAPVKSPCWLTMIFTRHTIKLILPSGHNVLFFHIISYRLASHRIVSYHIILYYIIFITYICNHRHTTNYIVKQVSFRHTSVNAVTWLLPCICKGVWHQPRYYLYVTNNIYNIYFSIWSQLNVVNDIPFDLVAIVLGQILGLLVHTICLIRFWQYVSVILLMKFEAPWHHPINAVMMPILSWKCTWYTGRDKQYSDRCKFLDRTIMFVIHDDF